MAGESLAGDAAELIQQMSPPQEHAIAEAAAEQATESGADIDSAGVGFDPTIHSVGSDGKGIKTGKGLWRNRRGAKSGARQGNPSFVGKPTRGTSQQAVEVVPDTKARAAGIAAAHTVFQIGVSVGGDEFYPRMIINESGKLVHDEKLAMETAWGDYFVARGIEDFPPGVALTIMMVSYIAPRFSMPVTQSRMERFKTWVGVKWYNWRASKRGARTNPGNDRIRQDDTSQTAEPLHEGPRARRNRT